MRRSALACGPGRCRAVRHPAGRRCRDGRPILPSGCRSAGRWLCLGGHRGRGRGWSAVRRADVPPAGAPLGAGRPRGAHRGCPRAAGARILPGRDPRADAHARVAEGPGRYPRAAQVQPTAAVRGAHVPFRRAGPGLARHGRARRRRYPRTGRILREGRHRAGAVRLHLRASVHGAAHGPLRGARRIPGTGGASVQPHRADGTSYAQSADGRVAGVGETPDRPVCAAVPVAEVQHLRRRDLRPGQGPLGGRGPRPWASARCTPAT